MPFGKATAAFALRIEDVEHFGVRGVCYRNRMRAVLD
jgi:hypothetical protein